MPKKNYNLKPGWTNIFQKMADAIEEYENPVLVKLLGQMQNELVKAIKDLSDQEVKAILNIIKDFIKSYVKNI